MSNRHRCEAARTAVGNGGGGDVDGPPSASSSLRDFYAKHGIDYAGLVASTGSSKQSKNDNVDSGHNNNDNTAEDLDDDQRSPTVPTHRFVRLNPRHDVEKTLRELKVRLLPPPFRRQSQTPFASLFAHMICSRATRLLSGRNIHFPEGSAWR